MNRSASICIALLTLSVPTFANLVVAVPNGSGAWYQGVTATESTGAFWDNKSKDGSNCNVGFWLQAGSWPLNCANQASSPFGTPPGQPLDYFAAAGSGSVGTTAAGWLFTPSGPNNVTLRVEVAGNAGANEVGWYTADANGNVVGNLNVLFSGSNNAPSFATINTASNFGFYLCKGGSVNGTCSASNLFLSGSANNGASTPNAGKFALFAQSPVHPNLNSQIQTYWMGIEDTPGDQGSNSEAWGDYNDLIIRATVVPEPGFYGVLAMGLSGLTVLVRRRKKQA
jgi:hypothetical protein